MSSSQSNFATATEMFKQVFEQVEKDKQQVEEEKKKWEEEKRRVRSTFKFDERRIMLDVGGTRYSTSCSTLTKYLVTALSLLGREFNVVSQDAISAKFSSASSSHNTDYPLGAFNVSYQSKQAISYEMKNMKKLSFRCMRFLHPASFISCDLSGASFTYCSFESDVTFKDCIIDGTTFSYIYGLVTNSHNVTFTGSNTDKTNFDGNLRSALQSAEKIK